MRHPTARTSLADLARAQRERTLVRVHRERLEAGHVTGRIVGLSRSLVAIATIDESLRPNGFWVVRRADISRFEAPDPYAAFVSSAIRLTKLRLARFPRISMSSWHELVTDAEQRFPLVTLHTEVVDPEVCYIGRPARITARRVELVTIGPDAAWDRDVMTFAWSDVTRVDFGGSYERALALVAKLARPRSGR